MSPQLWECKWLNDASVKGYQKGYAVWMNTNSYESLLNARHSQVMSYAKNNAILNPLLAKAEYEGGASVNEFLLKAMQGTASSNVSAMYQLGDMNSDV